MLKLLLSRLLDRSTPKTHKSAFDHVELEVETLESRLVPATGPYLGADGVIYMQTTDLGDKVTVLVQDPDGNESTYNDVVKVIWVKGDGQVLTVDFPFYSSAPSAYPPKVLVKGISIQGGTGNDAIWIQANVNIPCYLNGGQGNDELHGGKANDVIEGGAGSDMLWGSGGNDQLFACKKDASVADSATAVNILYGGLGNDKLYGGYKAAINQMWGGDGHDLLIGGDKAHNDMYGEAGHDYLRGGSSTSSGPMAFNLMVGGTGADVLQGGNYALNLIYAKEGNTINMDLIGLGYGSYTSYSIDTYGMWGYAWDGVSNNYYSEDYYLAWGF